MTQTFHCNHWFPFNFKKMCKNATTSLAKEVLESSGRQSASRITQPKLSSFNYRLKVETKTKERNVTDEFTPDPGC